MVVEHKNLSEIQKLNKRLTQLSILSIIMTEESKAWLRVHIKVLDETAKSIIFNIDNGSGDHVFIVFSEKGCIIKGFDHESFFSPYARDKHHVWPGIYDNVPQELLCLLDDPMFEKDDVTFCIWRTNADLAWQKGNIENPNSYDDGSNFLIGFLFALTDDYVEWANDYYGQDVSAEVINDFFQGAEINKKIIMEINPERDPDAALGEIAVL